MLTALLLFSLAAPDATGRLQAALVYEQQGDDARALEELEQLIAVDPVAVLPRLEAGRLRLKSGARLDLAEWHVDVARSLAPENPRAHYLWALVCEERGRRPAARRALEVALTLRPDYPDAQFRLAGVLFADGDFEGAATWYRAYAAQHPEATGARLQLAEALARGGQVAKAEAELRELMKGRQSALAAGRKLAELLERGGRTKEAAKLRAELDPPARKLRALKPSRR